MRYVNRRRTAYVILFVYVLSGALGIAQILLQEPDEDSSAVR